MALCAALVAVAVACDKKDDSSTVKPNGNNGDTTITVGVAVTSVTLNHATVALAVGDTLRLTATVLPDSATSKAVAWTSNSTAVATVSNGKVTAVAEGSATITVTTHDGGKTAACAVTVISVPSSWSTNFGTASFVTAQLWTAGAQTWSDAVQATGCNKTNFNGSNPDCRSNPDYKGDLFSWRAVDSYKSQLCPDGWRVPTQQDFINLDIALGGTGNNQQDNSTHRDKYLNAWGGIFGGYCYSDGTLNYQGLSATYWSQSEYNSDNAYYLFFNSDSHVFPQFFSGKSNGLSLRCVK